MRRAVFAMIVAGALLAAPACGGDDAFPRDEFVDQVASRGIERPVAECTYEKIVGNQPIMDDLKKAGGPNDNITARTDSKLSNIIVGCLLAADKKQSSTKKKSG